MPSAQKEEQPSWLARLITALAGVPQLRDQTELLKLLHTAEVRDLLGQETLTMIEGVLRVARKQVRDIMIPRINMVMVQQDAPLEALLETARSSGHSRLPVRQTRTDSVEGILLAKDLLAHVSAENPGTFDIKDAMRPAPFVPESKRLNVLLGEFRHNRNHMAIVVDEYGSTAGLVTIEDIIEEIVGEIEDEHDPEYQERIRKTGKNRYEVEALTSIEEFNKHFHTDFEDGEYDTIGGMLIQYLGHVPEANEELKVNNLHFRVLQADKQRIHFVELNLPKPTRTRQAASQP